MHWKLVFKGMKEAQESNEFVLPTGVSVMSDRPWADIPVPPHPSNNHCLCFAFFIATQRGLILSPTPHGLGLSCSILNRGGIANTVVVHPTIIRHNEVILIGTAYEFIAQFSQPEMIPTLPALDLGYEMKHWSVCVQIRDEGMRVETDLRDTVIAEEAAIQKSLTERAERIQKATKLLSNNTIAIQTDEKVLSTSPQLVSGTPLMTANMAPMIVPTLEQESNPATQSPPPPPHTKSLDDFQLAHPHDSYASMKGSSSPLKMRVQIPAMQHELLNVDGMGDEFSDGTPFASPFHSKQKLDIPEAVSDDDHEKTESENDVQFHTVRGSVELPLSDSPRGLLSKNRQTMQSFYGGVHMVDFLCDADRNTWE
eukprot:PhF_6_TR37207/c1_g1_i3/m.54848